MWWTKYSNPTFFEYWHDKKKTNLAALRNVDPTVNEIKANSLQ